MRRMQEGISGGIIRKCTAKTGLMTVAASADTNISDSSKDIGDKQKYANLKCGGEKAINTWKCLLPFFTLHY